MEPSCRNLEIATGIFSGMGCAGTMVEERSELKLAEEADG